MIANLQQGVTIKNKYIACMILAGVGDSVGYRNGLWEFNTHGERIHQDLAQIGGIENLTVEGWKVSDDTVMHLATAEALVANCETYDKLYRKLAQRYISCFSDMKGRAPGGTTESSVNQLRPYRKNGYFIPFNKKGGGCGAAMRAACIGLRFPKPEQLPDLIAVAIESGRMTHNHPTGYLGAVVAALFTSYALQNVNVVEWGRKMLNILPSRVMDYIQKIGRDVEQNQSNMDYFFTSWSDYLRLRCILNESQDFPIFPQDFGVKERDEFYKSVSFGGWGGSSGHDAPLIAYDALLGALYVNTDPRNAWNEVLLRGALHGGDSDSTGTIACAWYGALFGLTNVNQKHYELLEYRNRMEDLGDKLLITSEKPYLDEIPKKSKCIIL